MTPIAHSLKVGQLPKKEMSGDPFEITPEWAHWALETYNTHNRRRAPGVIARYASEVSSGTWQLTHQGIAFSLPPVFLVDGQHRLAAVVMAKHSAVMRVFLDADPATQLVVDDHLTRRFADAFTLTGLPVNTTEVAVARAMLHGPIAPQQHKVTKTVLRDFIIEHNDAIRFAVTSVPGKQKGVTSASCLAVVARAYYHAQQVDLIRFMKALHSGIPEQTDEAAATPLTLRKYLVERNASGSGSMGKLEVFKKVQRMLKGYLDGESLLKCTSSDKDLFPLPITRSASTS